MAINQVESSRISDGTLSPVAGHTGNSAGTQGESTTISRDDERDGSSAPPVKSQSGSRRLVLSANTLAGDRVRNKEGELLGSIEEIMLDVRTGHIAYAVLSFGGFMGIGCKLFAVPWNALQVNNEEHEFILDFPRESLENAPGFDKDNWPDMADPAFGNVIHKHYGTTPYWEQKEITRHV